MLLYEENYIVREVKQDILWSLSVIPAHSSHLLLSELCSQGRPWCACPVMVTSVTHSGWALLKVVFHAIGCERSSLMSLVNKIYFLFMF